MPIAPLISLPDIKERVRPMQIRARLPHAHGNCCALSDKIKSTHTATTNGLTPSSLNESKFDIGKKPSGFATGILALTQS